MALTWLRSQEAPPGSQPAFAYRWCCLGTASWAGVECQPRRLSAPGRSGWTQPSAAPAGRQERGTGCPLIVLTESTCPPAWVSKKADLGAHRAPQPTVGSRQEPSPQPRAQSWGALGHRARSRVHRKAPGHPASLVLAGSGAMTQAAPNPCPKGLTGGFGGLWGRAREGQVEAPPDRRPWHGDQRTVPAGGSSLPVPRGRPAGRAAVAAPTPRWGTCFAGSREHVPSRRCSLQPCLPDRGWLRTTPWP